MNRTGLRVLVAVFAGALIAGCDRDQLPAGPDSLVNQFFSSTMVTFKGEPRSVASKQAIEIGFPRQKGRMSLTWDAGCNSFGARVQVRQRLVVDRIVGTEMLCNRALMEQDDWLIEFFDSDPEWELIGNRLSLSDGDSKIELLRNRE